MLSNIGTEQAKFICLDIRFDTQNSQTDWGLSKWKPARKDLLASSSLPASENLPTSSEKYVYLLLPYC